MLVEERITTELFKQVEHYMWLMLLDRAPDTAQFAPHPNRPDLMTHRPQRGDDVILGPPAFQLFVFYTSERVGRDQVLMHKDDDAQLFFRLAVHKAIR